MKISKKLLTIIGALILVAVVALATENNMMKKTTKKIVGEDTMKKESLEKMEKNSTITQDMKNTKNFLTIFLKHFILK